MRFLLASVFIVFLIISYGCLQTSIPTAKPIAPISGIHKEVLLDSVQIENYSNLSQLAVCLCVYAALKNEGVSYPDVSPTIYAEMLGYLGVDTVSRLAKKAAADIQPSTIKDYNNSKPIFLRCSNWARSHEMDSLLRRYALYKMDKEVWIYDTIKK